MAMRRERTKVVNKDELEFMVTEFHCKDESMFSSLGKHCKEQTWKIQMGLDTKPMLIKVEVDQSHGKAKEKVLVMQDSTKLYPKGKDSKAALLDNFVQEWPFRAQAKGIGEKGQFEVRPENSSMEVWYPATLDEQKEDGTFKATVLIPDGFGNIKDEVFPSVRPEDVRQTYSGKMLEMPRSLLRLVVPRDAPLKPILSMNENDLVTHFFARPTPNPKSKKKVGGLFKVSKDHEQVTSDQLGYGQMRELVNLTPRQKDTGSTKTKHWWTFTLGPDIEHKVEVEKRWKSGKIVTVTVDGEILVDCTGEDIDTEAPSIFDCSFRFVGEKIWKFEVFETDGNTFATGSKSVVKLQEKYAFDCCLKLEQTADPGHLAASFFIGENKFHEFPTDADLSKDKPGIDISCDNFFRQFGIKVPYKVNKEAAAGIGGFVEHVKNNGIMSFLKSCMCPPSVDPDYPAQVVVE